jgi:uncharacterized YigZ family protein
MAENKILYTTIKNEAVAEFEEKRSLFIGHAKPVKTEEEAAEFIKAKKKEFSDATHNVSGYLIKNGIIARYSDDGEPQGTAGMPVLDTIRKSGVTDACVVVTRYFGGILLGAGGLVRAYSHGAKLALEAAEIITYEQYTVLRIRCNYSDYQKIQPNFFKVGAIIDDTDFGENVITTLAVKDEVVPSLSEKIREITSGRAITEIVGQRFDYR